MKKLLILFAALTISVGASAQGWGKAISGGLKAAQALTISDSDMAEMARQSIQQLYSQNKIAPANSPYTERLNRVTAGITDADGIPLNFKVYILNEVNAFACPDGSVRVYSGLMDLMNDDELIGVIGHEIGHVLKRHSKKAYRTALLTSAGRDAISARGGKLGALTDSQLGDIGESLINSKYSRSEEKEADDVGYDFLVANKRNPWAMAMAFEKMQQLEQQSGAQQSAIAKMFSSHPDVAARVKKMTQRAIKDGYARPEKK
ncbi:MAG: M48 family metallopeptidase [Paramuribaculum sp.]|nr:M48 family metallopeptidase [Paramuribaculum sp.]